MKKEHSLRLKKGCSKSIIALLVAPFVLIAIVCIDYGRVKGWGVEAEPPDWLPSSSTRVTFIETGSRRVAEFSVDSEVFQKWCSQTGMPLTKLEADQVKVIRRPNYALADKGKIENFEMSGSSHTDEDFQTIKDWLEVSLGQGDFFYSKRHANAGGYTLGYDSEAGIGYYSYSHR